MGILMDTPTGNGGNTNSGPLASRSFLIQTNWKDICDLILNAEDGENYAQLLGYLNSFLAVLQGVDSRKRDVALVFKVGIEVMKHLKTAFLDEKGESWVSIIPTIHQMLADGSCFPWIMVSQELDGLKAQWKVEVNMSIPSKVVLLQKHVNLL